MDSGSFGQSIVGICPLRGAPVLAISSPREGSGRARVECTLSPRNVRAGAVPHTVHHRFMNLESILFSQGFGSRRQCRALIADGRVAIDDAVLTDAGADLPAAGLTFSVDGVAWPYREFAYVVLNKPA